MWRLLFPGVKTALSSPAHVLGDLSARACYFLASAVAKADVEQEPITVSGFVLGFLHCRQHTFWELQDTGRRGRAVKISLARTKSYTETNKWRRVGK